MRCLTQQPLGVLLRVINVPLASAHAAYVPERPSTGIHPPRLVLGNYLDEPHQQ